MAVPTYESTHLAHWPHLQHTPHLPHLPHAQQGSFARVARPSSPDSSYHALALERGHDRLYAHPHGLEESPPAASPMETQYLRRDVDFTPVILDEMAM